MRCFHFLYSLLGLCILALSLQYCKNESFEKNEFMSLAVTLPSDVLKIESGGFNSDSLPKNCNRLIYYYFGRECYPCLVSHTYELCNLFDHTEYSTIILFCPPADKYDSVVELLITANYDFPVYCSKEGNKELEKKLSKLQSRSFLLGKNNIPSFVGDPVRDDDAYNSFISALKYESAR